jgi:hypothetical protein
MISWYPSPSCTLSCFAARHPYSGLAAPYHCVRWLSAPRRTPEERGLKLSIGGITIISRPPLLRPLLQVPMDHTESKFEDPTHLCVKKHCESDSPFENCSISRYFPPFLFIRNALSFCCRLVRAMGDKIRGIKCVGCKHCKPARQHLLIL